MQGEQRRTTASTAENFDPASIRERIGFLLRQTQQLFQAGLTPELAVLGVTPGEAETATFIAARPGLDQISSAQLLGLSVADLILVADVLEMKGVAMRELIEHRRRALTPTPRGLRLVRQAESIFETAAAMLWAPIAPAHADDLKEMLSALALNPASDAPVWIQEGESPPLFGGPHFLMRRNLQILAALFHEETAPFDMTVREYGELSRIAAFATGGAPAAIKLYAAARSSLAPTIKLLEARGYICRRRDPQDGRRRTLALQPAGSALLHRMQPAVVEVERRFLRPLGPSGESFRQALGHLVRAHGAA